jgi:hypothetical protein
VDYLTFVATRDGTWRLHRGVGSVGELLGERRDVLALRAIAAAAEAPILWISDAARGVERLRLPALLSEPVVPLSGRVSAIAASADGEQIVALELPDEAHGQVRLMRGSGSDWQRLDPRPLPHISSGLAWIGEGRVAYETVERRLAVLNLGEGKRSSVGPPGRSPAAAPLDDAWFAITPEGVVRFGLDDDLFRVRPAGFDFGRHVSQMQMTSDGEICAWTEQRFHHRVKGYLQRRGGRRQRQPEGDTGLAAILGPFELS